MIKPGGVRNRTLVLAALLLLGCAAALAVVAQVGLRNLANLPEPLLMPGTHTVQVKSVGTQYIADEKESIVGGRMITEPRSFFWGGPTRPTIDVTVRGPDGAKIDVAPSKGSTTYKYGYRSGEILMEFPATQPGPYEISAFGGSEYVLAVGHFSFLVELGRIFIGIGGAALFSVAAAVLLIFALWRRLHQRRTPAAT
jgi:hypothetical protein